MGMEINVILHVGAQTFLIWTMNWAIKYAKTREQAQIHVKLFRISVSTCICTHSYLLEHNLFIMFAVYLFYKHAGLRYRTIFNRNNFNMVCIYVYTHNVHAV